MSLFNKRLKRDDEDSYHMSNDFLTVGGYTIPMHLLEVEEDEVVLVVENSSNDKQEERID